MAQGGGMDIGIDRVPVLLGYERAGSGLDLETNGSLISF